MNWISVEDKEKLPEDLQDVLFTDGKGVYKGYFRKDEYSPGWTSCSGFKISDVTYWMPLPPLPKE